MLTLRKNFRLYLPIIEEFHKKNIMNNCIMYIKLWSNLLSIDKHQT
jgi:hypothetical protein